jgi:plastocyanin domain-containing protein
MQYKVWISVEEIDEANNHYEDQDLNVRTVRHTFAGEVTCGSLKEATRYANALHAVAAPLFEAIGRKTP